jgi:hypothetical protein
MTGYKPTCELRVAEWNFGNQRIEQLQQKWVSDIEGEEPEWRNVTRWFMHLGEPFDGRWPA